MNYKKMITVRIRPDDLHAIMDVCKTRHETKSSLIRRALRNELEKYCTPYAESIVSDPAKTTQKTMVILNE